MCCYCCWLSDVTVVGISKSIKFTEIEKEIVKRKRKSRKSQGRTSVNFYCSRFGCCQPELISAFVHTHTHACTKFASLRSREREPIERRAKNSTKNQFLVVCWHLVVAVVVVVVAACKSAAAAAAAAAECNKQNKEWRGKRRIRNQRRRW